MEDIKEDQEYDVFIDDGDDDVINDVQRQVHGLFLLAFDVLIISFQRADVKLNVSELDYADGLINMFIKKRITPFLSSTFDKRE